MLTYRRLAHFVIDATLQADADSSLKASVGFVPTWPSFFPRTIPRTEEFPFASANGTLIQHLSKGVAEPVRRLLAWMMVLSLLLMPALAQAETAVRLVVDGVEIETDVAPVLEENRTLVPIRAVTEALGFEVAWDPDTRTATLTRGETTIVLTADNPEVLVNGEPVTLDVAPAIRSDRMMVPVRFVAEQIGLEVGWDQETMTVLIGSAAPAAPTVDPAALALVQRAQEAENVRGTGGFTMTMDGGMIVLTSEMSMDIYQASPDESITYFTVRMLGEELSSAVAVYGEKMWMKDETGTWVAMSLEDVVPVDPISDPTSLASLNPADVSWASVTLSQQTYEGTEMQVVTMIVDEAGFAELLGDEGMVIGEGRMELVYWFTADETLHHADLLLEVAVAGPEPVRMTMTGSMFWEPLEGPVEFPPEITGAGE